MSNHKTSQTQTSYTPPNQQASGPKSRGPGRGGPGGMHGLGAPFEKPKNFKGTLKRLYTYLKPLRIKLSVVVVLAILGTLFSIISPKLMGNVVTEIFRGIMGVKQGLPGAGINQARILQLIIMLAGLYLLSSLFMFIMQFVMAGAAQEVVSSLRTELHGKLGRIPLSYYDSHAHGDILSRMTNDMDTIGSTLQQSIMQLITSLITLIGVVVMMLTISPLLTLVTILTIPLSIIATKAIAKRSQLYFKEQQKALGNLNGHIEEMYTGHTVVNAFDHEETSIATFKELNETLYVSGWKAQFISGIIMPVMTGINNLGYIIVCVVGGIFVTRRAIEIGDIQAFIQYSRQFTQPIVQTATIANIIQSTIAAAERIFEILDEEEQLPDSETAVLPFSPPRGVVTFEHVYFSYDASRPLIQDLGLHAEKGQNIAIVGPTGAGKTTLVNLLMRFYEIQSGRIAVDGISISDIKRGALRSLFGMVLQDTWLFNGTIRDNIAYGKAQATEEEIVAAAKAAHADHFIRTLPDGYQTVLNEEASNISQGQKQLITIARALLADPAIMILDEATSNVDTRTEVLIQQAMKTLMKGRTNFVIAHRLSTIQDADCILVMREGSIIEMGTHRELLRKQGFYAELFKSQFEEPAITQGSIAL